MKKIGLFWGSTSGNTEMASEFIKEYLELNDFKVESLDISEHDIEEMGNYDNIIIGCPTWNIGELQDDWDSMFTKYKSINFSGKIGAFFGCGDQVGYSFNFLDAIGILYDPFIENGGTVIGECDIDNYEFDDSKALRDGRLVGLGLDYDNNSDDDCELAMIAWLDEIMEEFK